ncbi:TonB-dependent receptor [uncultured Polaribacter sp.]|uniref:TonB-dependent receptor n=1 Tax=uncultured Polaribacter sp. TaxID=174711 RepID=UPI00263390D3|nr:TonB-dependent receptor [uncultured Polaribacter sp.]
MVQPRILFFIFFSITFTGFCQSKIKGKIVDSNNGTPLPITQIINLTSKENTTSNIDGTFEVLNSDSYLFKRKGYIDKIVELKNHQFYIIQLEINPSELHEVIITTNHIPKKLKKATAAISIISSEDLQRSNNTDFAPILNRASGVFMQSGALNTNRITIRGIGARNLFGTSKIRAYFKDIPLTNGSGETTIEDFELASISRFEIIKGAASSIYGAGLGGVIHITPQNGFLNQSSINGELLIGSFGLNKQILNLNHGTSKNSFRAVYSNTHSDGYRDNNQYDRQTFTINSNHFLSEKDEVSFLASFVDLKAFIPSSINEAIYLNNPKSAAFTWKQAQGFEDAKRGVFGATWNHDYTTSLKLVTSIFSSFRDAYEPRPFNILKENIFAFGMRSRFLGNTKLFSKTLNWTIGGELFKDSYKYETFENLHEDSPVGIGSVKGDRISNFKENRKYYNLFFETNYEFSEKTTFSAGLNINETSYDLEDQFQVSADNPDQSGSFKFKNIVSPKFGLSHLFSEDMSVFASVSHGFSPISLNETLLPDGQINTSLKPETGWNFEVGSRGEFFNNKFQYNVAIYRLSIKNLLVSRRTAQDEFVGINAGKTQHDGLELAINYKWLQKENVTINTFINYTRNNFIFKEFIDDTDDFSGNDLTGVPKDVFNAGIDFNSMLGFYGNINFQYVGSMPVTDSNSLFSDSYKVTNLKIGYRKNLTKKLQFNTFFGVNNIFDEAYASQILINASSFGGNAPRYYYPGNPINFYAGIRINYIF